MHSPGLLQDKCDIVFVRETTASMTCDTAVNLCSYHTIHGVHGEKCMREWTNITVDYESCAIDDYSCITKSILKFIPSKSSYMFVPLSL